MRSFFDLLVRFRDDERGIFAVIFGVLAIVLVAVAGAAVDYTAVETARTRAQVALDSAALGLQPKMYDTTPPTNEQFKTRAEELLKERLADNGYLTLKVESATATTSDGTLRLKATVKVPMSFVALVGVSSITATVVSEATRKRLNLEIAMVLDNSGSMGWYDRMTNLKKAARCAMNVLYNAITECSDATLTATDSKAATEKNIWVGIVPFTGFVNVGTGYNTATWMDTTGISNIANDNFDSDDNDTTPYNSAVNRFSLYSAIGVSWRGCVEARKYPYDTDDTVPSIANTDTLFVPEFAPDAPDTGNYYNDYLNDRPAACTNKDAGTWKETRTKTNCDTTNYNNCSVTPTIVITQTNASGASVTAAATPPATMTDTNGNVIAASCSAATSSVKTNNNPKRYTDTYTNTCSYQFTDRVLQERLCKYTANNTKWNGGSPNDDCPTNSLTPLTETKSTIKSAIDAMYPQGFTNIHQGTIWGFHMLSPTEPLTQGKAYDAATSKVMIVMTDGENTVDAYGANALNKADTFQAYGWPGAPSSTGGVSYNGRIYSNDYPSPDSDEEVTASMDTRTLEACTNAKKEGITIYTIGLSAPNQKTIDLLTDCATVSSNAYFPTDPTKLTDVFKEIADQLANLRLSQ